VTSRLLEQHNTTETTTSSSATDSTTVEDTTHTTSEPKSDLMEEFFALTAYSVAICNCIDIDAPDTKRLYMRACASDVPFYQVCSSLNESLMVLVVHLATT